MTFARLRPWHWVAFIASLALLFVSATDWYSTRAGDEARRLEHLAQPHGALGGEVSRNVQEDAKVAAEGQEKNAWQVDGAIDRVILIGLLATALLGVLAAFYAASGREGHSALPPPALAGLAAGLTALLVVYRIVQEPGFDEATTVKLGAPLALLVLGVISFASASSLREEPAERPAEREEEEEEEEQLEPAPWEGQAPA
jgi:drug/metabolite transporter (DMT)-like permease